MLHVVHTSLGTHEQHDLVLHSTYALIFLVCEGFESCLINLHGVILWHSYDILGAGMLWKPEEARILKNFINQWVNIR